MVLLNLMFIQNRDELRTWLEGNHSIESECWVPVKKGKPPAEGLWYVDAVEEALCFGWIDSTLKKLPDGTNIQKIMPRSIKSHWSELNKERARRMERLGLMTDAGRKVCPPLDDPFIIEPDILDAMQKDKNVWENFIAFPPLYQRIRIDNIQSYRKNEKQFSQRLQKLIDTSRLKIMYGQWNDYGRLR